MGEKDTNLEENQEKTGGLEDTLAENEETQQPEGQDQKKLYAGKFESDSDLEKAYQELEAQATEARERAARAERLLELNAGAQTSATQQYPQQQQFNQQGAQDTDTDDDVNLFDPVERKKFIHKVKQEAFNTAQSVTVQQQNIARVVEDFRKKNPDLVPYERLVESYVVQTDPRLAPEKRIEEAVAATRKELARMKDELKKGESSGRTREGTTLKGNSSKPKSEPAKKEEKFENPVQEEMAARSSIRAQRLGLATQK